MNARLCCWGAARALLAATLVIFAPSRAGAQTPLKVGGFFAQWGIYNGHSNYFPAHVPYADVDTINYGFAGMAQSTDPAHPEWWDVVSIDTFADFTKNWAGPKSPLTDPTDLSAPYGNIAAIRWYIGMRPGEPLPPVGTAGTIDPVTGKAFWQWPRGATNTPSPNRNPNCKFVLSIGGWNGSATFSTMASTQSGRDHFASECARWCHAYLFDGVDVDWEYPVGGGKAGNAQSPADKANFTSLLASIRSALNAQGAADGRTYLLSYDLGGGKTQIDNIEVVNTLASVDYVNVMNFDYHGIFDAPMIALHHSALNQGVDPNAQLNCSWTFNYLIGTVGATAGKLNFAIPYYTRGWVGATQIGQAATGGATGIWDDTGVNSGINPLYYVYGTMIPSGYALNRDAAAGDMPWLFKHASGKDNIYVYDDTTSVTDKLNFAKSKSVRGVWFWEFSGDYSVTGNNNDNFSKHAMSDFLNTHR
jgi:GH18 family chitinase